MSAHVLSTLIILSSPHNMLYLCISYTVRLMLNTTPPLQGFCPQNLLLPFMSNQHIKKMISFTVYCCRLVCNLALATETMWSCKECISWSLSYCVSSESFKCSECVSHTSCKCDLIISEAEWAWVHCKHVWLQVEVQLAMNWAQKEMTHLSHLQKQQDLIESCWEEMI